MPQGKGKLLVMTLLDFQKILKYPEIWSNNSSTQNKVDFLELFRILVLQQNTSPLPVQSDVVRQKLNEETIDPHIKVSQKLRVLFH